MSRTRYFPPRWCRLFNAVMGGYVLLWSAAVLAEEEYLVKALLLERLTRFVTWPESAPVNQPQNPFVLCVIGENPFGLHLETIYATQLIKKKPVTIRYIAGRGDHEGIRECALLFITHSAAHALQQILDITRTLPILTVGDTLGFGEKGVLINFYFSKARVRFEINQTAVLAAGLQVEYLLYLSARILHPVGRPIRKERMLRGDDES